VAWGSEVARSHRPHVVPVETTEATGGPGLRITLGD
jgi:hypothetical protein